MYSSDIQTTRARARSLLQTQHRTFLICRRVRVWWAIRVTGRGGATFVWLSKCHRLQSIHHRLRGEIGKEECIQRIIGQKKNMIIIIITKKYLGLRVIIVYYYYYYYYYYIIVRTTKVRNAQTVSTAWHTNRPPEWLVDRLPRCDYHIII